MPNEKRRKQVRQSRGDNGDKEEHKMGREWQRRHAHDDGEREEGYHERVPPPALRKRMLQLLKLIGVALFLWILSRIDRDALFLHLRNAEPLGIAASFLGLFLMYALKAARWHVLVRSTGLTPSWMDSWRLFNIGIFLGAITPANMGEMGRAAYLRRMGVHTGTALAIPLIDRIADVAIMGTVGIWSIGFIFGWQWSLIAGCTGILGMGIVGILWERSKGLRAQEWLAFLQILARPPMLYGVLLWTILSWIVYFGWTFLLAQALGLSVSFPVLAAALTLTGILVFIPIAPSGLGTREAALITFLAPYGIAAPQAVALALVVFLLVIGSSTLGLWYWVRDGHRSPARTGACARG